MDAESESVKEDKQKNDKIKLNKSRIIWLEKKIRGRRILRKHRIRIDYKWLFDLQKVKKEEMKILKEMKKQNVDDDFEFSYRTWKFKDEILGFSKMKMIKRILLREKAPVIRSTDEKLFGHIKDEYRRRVKWIEVKQQIRLEVEKDSLKVKIVKMKALALILIIGVCTVFWQLGTAQPVNKVVDDKIVPVDIEYGAHHVYDEVTGKLTNYGKADYIRIGFLIIGYAIYYLPKDIKLYKKIRRLCKDGVLMNKYDFYMEDDDYSNVFKDNIDTELTKMEKEVEQLEYEKIKRTSVNVGV